MKSLAQLRKLLGSGLDSLQLYDLVCQHRRFPQDGDPQVEDPAVRPWHRIFAVSLDQTFSEALVKHRLEMEEVEAGALESRKAEPPE